MSEVWNLSGEIYRFRSKLSNPEWSKIEYNQKFKFLHALESSQVKKIVNVWQWSGCKSSSSNPGWPGMG